ncbi:MAG TPA: FAD-dependent oxidoreductase [Solirubrobacterales bacterium]|nr:FAD-dependent oxidoreductase [Solirubrobacterales bacterium]
MGSTDIEADVVVVGAGLAGLAAARALVRSGASVVVLEARDRVGGRTLNEDLGEGKVVEVGGEWIGPTQDRLAALAAELGVETFPTYIEGENTLELNGRLTRYEGTIPKLNPAALVEVELASRKLNRMARRVRLEAPWETRDAAKLDGTTLATWLDRRIRTATARKLIETAVRTVWGADSRDLSLLYALSYIGAAGGFYALLDTEGGAQQDRFVGGSQLISLRMAEALGDRVVPSAPVQRVEHATGVTVWAGNLRARGLRAIVTCPPPACARIDWQPPLPMARAQLMQRMPGGSYLKCQAIYEQPFWRGDGLSGEGVSDAGPATTTFDNSPPEGSPGVLLGFVSGSDARTQSRLGASERRRAVLEGFERLYGPRARHPERYIEQDWSRDPWTGGAPIFYMPPGTWTGFGPALREPVGPVHWAGSETATRWAGYMDGAVRSGERAAADVLASL